MQALGLARQRSAHALLGWALRLVRGHWPHNLRQHFRVDVLQHHAQMCPRRHGQQRVVRLKAAIHGDGSQCLGREGASQPGFAVQDGSVQPFARRQAAGQVPQMRRTPGTVERCFQAGAHGA
ncbi:MAG: hypothetical protein ING52_10470 [Burkholderiales bacterium]|nr:hypothetical protein [Burkholderiales bacterium]